MEGQSQAHRNNHYKTDQPQHQGHARGGLERHPVELRKDQDGNDLHPSSHARDLLDTSEADKPENDEDIGETQAVGGRKRAEYAVEATGDHDPLDNRVTDEKESKTGAPGALHAFLEG